MSCRECEARNADLIDLLRQKVVNQQAVIDTLTDELDDAQALAHNLACELIDRDPEWLETTDEDTRELWDIVAPFGRDAEPEN